MDISAECLERMLRAHQRYDMPKISTVSLLLALENLLGSHRVFITRSSVDLLDVIRQVIPIPSVQEVQIAAYLIGQDFEPDDIVLVTNVLSIGPSALTNCPVLTERQRDDLRKLLEAKP